ncbi:hypothetical protein [Nocardia sp. NPDC004604]|uniref:hypothetical protein n=1 Tax=Nocardia sp. NPDC004604 TaxID=3157013 RepID=UPI00339F11F7
MASRLDIDFVVIEGSEPLEVLQSASRVEADRVISQLSAAAADGGPVARNVHAAALGLVGRLEEAEVMWSSLTGDHPGFVEGWLNLASVQCQLGQVEQAIETLEACNLNAREELEYVVSARLRALRQHHAAALLDREMLSLRVAALRERFALCVAEPGDLKLLAVSLSKLHDLGNSGVRTAEVAAAARQAYSADPSDVPMLELLALYLLAIKQYASCAVAVLELEERAPHSRLLEALRTGLSTEEASQIGFRYTPPGNTGAAEEVREWSNADPETIGIDVRLMTQDLRGFLLAGEFSKGVVLADHLAAIADEDYLVHLRISMAYWLHGERNRALGHLWRAHEFAKTPEEHRMIDHSFFKEFLHRNGGARDRD